MIGLFILVKQRCKRWMGHSMERASIMCPAMFCISIVVCVNCSENGIYGYSGRRRPVRIQPRLVCLPIKLYRPRNGHYLVGVHAGAFTRSIHSLSSGCVVSRLLLLLLLLLPLGHSTNWHIIKHHMNRHILGAVYFMHIYTNSNPFKEQNTNHTWIKKNTG